MVPGVVQSLSMSMSCTAATAEAIGNGDIRMLPALRAV